MLHGGLFLSLDLGLGLVVRSLFVCVLCLLAIFGGLRDGFAFLGLLVRHGLAINEKLYQYLIGNNK